MINQFVRLKCWTWTVSLNSKSWVEIRILKASFSYLHKTHSIYAGRKWHQLISTLCWWGLEVPLKNAVFSPCLPLLFTHTLSPTMQKPSLNDIKTRHPIILQAYFLASMHLHMFKNKLFYALFNMLLLGSFRKPVYQIEGELIIAMCCVSYIKMNKITVTIICMQTAASSSLVVLLRNYGFLKKLQGIIK